MVWTRRFLTLLFLTLLLSSLVVADCYPSNAPDGDWAQRAATYEQALRSSFVSLTPLFQSQDPVPEAYPAALFFFSKNDDALAEQVLAGELEKSTELSPLSALYAAWILHDKQLSTDLANTLRDAVTSSLSTREQYDGTFLQAATQFLLDQSNTNDLVVKLRTSLKDGWSVLVETNPERLANVVIGLAALYSQDDDLLVKKLAEANLDLIFSRAAVTTVGGFWVSPTAGNTPSAAPWPAWSYLLFGETSQLNPSFHEPGLLLSGYVPHVVTRSLTGKSVIAKNKIGDFSLRTVRTDTYVLSAAEDVENKMFTSDDGFVTKARLLFNDPTLFVTFTSRTSPDATDGEVGGATVLLKDRVILGKLDTPSCGEPHALLTVDDEFVSLGGVWRGLVVQSGDTYALVLFAMPVQEEALKDRYAPLANVLPDWLVGKAKVLFPVGVGDEAGVFSLEVLPQGILDEAEESRVCGDEGLIGLQCLARFLEEKVSLTYQNGEIIYTTKTMGSPEKFTFKPGDFATYQNEHVTFDHAHNLLVKKGSAHTYLSQESGVWTLQGQYDAQHAAVVTINPDGASIDEVKRVEGDGTYGCAPTPTASGGSSASPLGVAAASLLSRNDNAYVLDCAPGTNVLPTTQDFSDLVLGACTYRAGDDRIVVLHLDPDYQGGALQAALQKLQLFFPFAGNVVAPLDTTMCNDAFEATLQDGSFQKCGALIVADNGKGLVSYGKLWAWVNGQQNLLVLSSDENPFTSGSLDGLRDWLAGIFGSNEAAPATDALAFDAAYFAQEGARQIGATLYGTHATLAAKNLVESLEPFSTTTGVSWRAHGTTQELSFDASDTAKGSLWAGLTRSLRLTDVAGEPFTYQNECNGNPVEYAPECSPGEDLGACTTGDTSQRVVCGSDCLPNTTACGACEDKDGDGEPGPGCETLHLFDCDDASPSSRYVQDGASWVSCDAAPSCDPPYSQCPQCNNHNVADDVCDGVDNNCDGVIDPGCEGGDGSGDEGVSYTCADVPIDTCGYVCNVQTMIPPNTNPCPTRWETVKQQGHYTFATRLNGTAVPELRITADGQEEGSVECTLCQEGKCNENKESEMDATTDQRFFTAPQPSSPSYIFHNGGSKRADVSVLYDDGWKVSFTGSSGDAKTCWNVTGSSNPLVTIPKPALACSFDDCPTEWTDLGTQGHYNLAMRWAENGYPELRIKVVDPNEEQGVDCSALGVWGVPAADGEVVIPWRVTANKHYGNGVVVFDDGGAHATRITVYAYRDENQGSAFRLLAYAYGSSGGSDGTAACWGFNNDIFTDDNAVDFRTIGIFRNGFCHKRACTSNDECGSPTLNCSPVSSDLKLCLSAIEGPGACFTPATPILLANGSSVPMREVKVGDRVLGFDERSGTVAPTTVEQVLIHEIARDLVVVNGRLEVTPEHLLKVRGKGWVPAGSLRVGDLLQTPRGVEVVQHLERKSYTGKVYNLHNAPFHNYYAGGVLVHNTKATGRPLPSNGATPWWDEFFSSP